MYMIFKQYLYVIFLNELELICMYSDKIVTVTKQYLKHRHLFALR